MNGVRFRLPLFAVMFLLLFAAGCNQQAGREEEEGNIAYISVNQNSQYVKTFQDLNLGILYDFHLKLTQADQSWVTIWVEGYQHGKKTDPFRLTELSYGLHPTGEIVEGPMGFGLIRPQSDNTSLFLYSSGASIPPQEANIDLGLKEVGGSSWAYAIGEDTVGLASGETLVLGVYRQVKNSIRTYDYQNEDDVARMISEDVTVLLLKIKVQEGE